MLSIRGIKAYKDRPAMPKRKNNSDVMCSKKSEDKMEMQESCDRPVTPIETKVTFRVPNQDPPKLAMRKRSMSEKAFPSWYQADENTPLMGKSNGRHKILDDDYTVFPLSHTFNKRDRIINLANNIKIAILFATALSFSIIYASFPDLNYEWQQFSVSETQRHNLKIDNHNDYPVLKLYVKGKLSYRNPNIFTNNIIIKVTNPATNTTKKTQIVYLSERNDAPEITQTVSIDFTDEIVKDTFLVEVSTNSDDPTPVSLFITPLSIQIESGVISAAFILIGVYILIVFELIHRTLAAMLGALIAIAVLALTNEKPPMDRVISWLDYETLCLLFGMMVLVAILVDTGVFDWLALQAYRLAKGKTWPLITTLCIFSAVISAFLDNVTTILLLSPVTIRLCEVLDLDPKHVLMAEVLFSNIGGASTAIGDPPNVLIVSNKDIIDSGIGFGNFTLHMSIGSVLCSFGAYALLRFIYRRKTLLHRGLPREVAELKHEAEIWRRASCQITVASREEGLVKEMLEQKIASLEQRVDKHTSQQSETQHEFFKMQLSEMEKRYKIRDPILLTKSLIVLGAVIIGFFLTSVVGNNFLSIGWVPILGAVCLLILADYSDLESILHRIEWATLIFFSALFVLMQALTRLGLIDWIATGVTAMIKTLPEGQRLPIAIIVILWTSGICSSFIDNIPFTTAMLPVIMKLSGDETVNLPLQPLVWSLAFGACLGGNGTLIGASANVVCAGIADTHGHKFTFWEFFKIGFPTMLLTNLIAMIYLLICHAAIGWN